MKGVWGDGRKAKTAFVVLVGSTERRQDKPGKALFPFICGQSMVQTRQTRRPCELGKGRVLCALIRSGFLKVLYS